MEVMPAASYTLPEAARIIGVHGKSIYRLVRNGKLRAERDSTGRMRVSPHEVYAYLRQMEERTKD